VSALEPATSGTLAEAICMQVRAEILSGTRKPQARIRLEDLKSAFRVSWSPLREALSRLVAEGLIQVDESRGYRVAPVSRAEMADALYMRKALEAMALRASIEKGDDAWEAEVLAAHHRLSKLEAKRAQREELDEWERWHRTYHETLWRACGSPILIQYCTQISAVFARYRKLFLAANPFDAKVGEEHREIVDAVLARDADRACALLEEHIDRTGRNILACIRED
jgi:GntR family carbon starvation induced transcriptional regulator